MRVSYVYSYVFEDLTMRGRDVDQRETSHPLSFVRELVIWKRRFNMEEHICIRVWEWNNGRGCENSVAVERDPLFRYFPSSFHISFPSFRDFVEHVWILEFFFSIENINFIYTCFRSEEKYLGKEKSFSLNYFRIYSKIVTYLEVYLKKNIHLFFQKDL